MTGLERLSRVGIWTEMWFRAAEVAPSNMSDGGYDWLGDRAFGHCDRKMRTQGLYCIQNATEV